jgi:hypothetical protein
MTQIQLKTKPTEGGLWCWIPLTPMGSWAFSRLQCHIPLVSSDSDTPCFQTCVEPVCKCSFPIFSFGCVCKCVCVEWDTCVHMCWYWASLLYGSPSNSQKRECVRVNLEFAQIDMIHKKTWAQVIVLRSWYDGIQSRLASTLLSPLDTDLKNRSLFF